MRRRTLLSAGVLAAVCGLAGCFGRPTGELRLEPIEDVDLGDRAALDSDTTDRRYDLLEEAIETGAATATDTRPPVDPDWPVDHDGSYYRLTSERRQIDERTEFGIVVRSAADTPDEETVTFEDLPAIDRAVLEQWLPPNPDQPPVAVGDYDGDEREISMLVPDPEFSAVEYEGERYPIELDWLRTVPEYEFTFGADLVAADADAFRSWLRSTYRFDLDGLSEGERDIVEEAVDGTYLTSDPGDAFVSLAERFHDRPGFGVDERGGQWLLRYEGEEYWAELRHLPRLLGDR